MKGKIYLEMEDIIQLDTMYGYTTLLFDLKKLKERYPFIHIESIGSSIMNKSIYAIRLGIGKKGVFYSGDWHANEHLTGHLLMKFVEDYLKAYDQNTTLKGYDVSYLFSNTSIWIVPMVNPDGIELFLNRVNEDDQYYQTALEINNKSNDFNGWTANIRGVDLNHQWPANWEEENKRGPLTPTPKRYGGTKPLTEPEAKAIYNFTRNNQFSMVLAFHSQGREIFWGFKDFEPSESKMIVDRFGVLTGYTPIQSANSDAGYKDWFIQEYKKSGFTIEIGQGVNPLPLSQFKQIYNENLSLLLEAPLL